MKIPKHVAVIMDGNRRWAKAHNLPVLEGHRRVADDVLEPLIEHAADLGISYMTFWAWSTENWNRDRQEVTGIMKIFRHVLKNRLERLHRKNVRIITIGNVSEFDADIREMLARMVTKTKDNTRITAVFALNYGGRDEIVRAVNRLFHDQRRVRRSFSEGGSTINDQPVSPQLFSHYLDTADIPDPEIIIRTGGEHRTSGFLLWQSEYSEWFFPSWYMPGFTPEKLDEILGDFSDRNRRFGR